MNFSTRYCVQFYSFMKGGYRDRLFIRGFQGDRAVAFPFRSARPAHSGKDQSNLQRAEEKEARGRDLRVRRRGADRGRQEVTACQLRKKSCTDRGQPLTDRRFHLLLLEMYAPFLPFSTFFLKYTDVKLRPKAAKWKNSQIRT